ncbi:MAG: hypothetical protein IJ297_04325 [Clostridia bacterium]|nr:hypothetical protein [Clostridia bacterium]
MKKMLIATLSIVLSAGLILTVLIFGFNFRNIEQDKTYEAVENFDNYQIAEYVITQYFKYYKTHGLNLRLSDYKIDKIELCDDFINQEHIGTNNGFVFTVTYDVKPFFGNLFANWYAGNGSNNDTGWCVDKFGYYKVTAKDNEYVLDFLGTSI